MADEHGRFTYENTKAEGGADPGEPEAAEVPAAKAKGGGLTGPGPSKPKA